MIAGQPPAWQTTAPAQKPQTRAVSAQALRWVPAGLLSFVCLCEAACVILLVLLPATGVTPPLGTAFSSLGGDAAIARPSAFSAAVAWAGLFTYVLLWALAIASAIAVSRTPPGHIPLWLYSREPGDQAYFHNVLQAVEKKLDGSLRFCRKDGAFKPDRAHYCKELGLCILCYQHWDPWTNNAIGFYNHKSYLLSLLYGGCVHGAGLLLLLPRVQRQWPAVNAAQPPQLVLLHALRSGGDAALLGFAALATLASAVLAVSCLLWLGFHAMLVARGTTAHTFFRQGGWKRNKPPKPVLAGKPFDFGIKGNFLRAFGRQPFLWFLPTNQGVEGNGIFFELKLEPGVGGGGDEWASWSPK